MNLLAIKEISSKFNPELFKSLERNDNKCMELSELDRPILAKFDSNADIIEREVRPLTIEEKEDYKDKLGCSAFLLENATIDENGKIYIKTINESKEGQRGEDGVEYVRKKIEVNGIEVEGVFPQFESIIDVQLPDEMYQATDSEQARSANQKLKEKVQNDPEFAKQFSEDQLEQIENGETPDGYTWHHNEEPGKMQLIRTEDHQNNRHTGGKAIWGGGKENR